MTAVAVVGLGAMGSRIAARLLAAGHEVIVWNRSAAKTGPLAEFGAILAATPAEAASRAEVLITMVADPAALRTVTEGPDGVVAGASASLTVVEMSTVGPAAVTRLASALPRVTLAGKDARLIADAAAATGVDLRLITAAGTWLAEAEQAGLGDRDYTAMLKTILCGRGNSRTRHRPDAPPVPRAGRVGYDGLIIDLDGVIWRGGDPIPGAAEAIAAVRGSGTRVIFATNEPRRSRAALAQRLTEIGIPATVADVKTSAAVAACVAGSLPCLVDRRALVVGPPALHDEIQGTGFQLVACEQAREAEVVVVGGHERFDYRELRAAAVAVRGGARLIATGRDAIFPMPDGPWPATGAILAAIETAGGMPAVVVGKPERIMFDIAREALAGCTRIGVIGDHLTTDVEGAKRAGLDAILVLTGATSQADLEQAPIPPDLVLDSLAALPEAIQARA